MIRVVAAFGRNDLRSIRGDTVLMTVLVAPLLYAIVLWFVPACTGFAAEVWAFDLTPYHSLIVSGFAVLGPCIVLGTMCGLLLLDDKDQHTLTALRVTPLPPVTYPAYRAAMTIGLITATITAVLALSPLASLEVVAKGVVVGVVGGLLGVIVGLLMAGLAGNKIEGIAIIKAIGGLIAIVPLIPFFFLDSPWQLAFGVLPSYWPARALWAAMDGGPFWPYIFGGLVYNAGVALLLLRLVGRRLAAS